MSKELGKAFSEFYKLGASDKWCCLNISFDYNYVAYISLIPSGYNRKGKHEPVVDIQSTEIDTEKGMIEFLKRAVTIAKLYEKQIEIEKE